MQVLVPVTVVVLLIAALIYPRLMRIDPERWHVDPLAAQAPGISGVQYLPGAASPVAVYAAAPEAVLEAFDAAVTAYPRTERIAGTVGSGRVTYLYRSPVFGFADMVTVTPVEVEGGTTLAILARSSLGRWVDDWNTNAGRVRDWLEQVDAKLGS